MALRQWRLTSHRATQLLHYFEELSAESDDERTLEMRAKLGKYAP